MEVKRAELKPCPFCGVMPELYWEPWKEISPDAGIYVLEAYHKISCYIPHINGMNSTGRMSASNKECLVNWWNRRAGDDSRHKYAYILHKETGIPISECIEAHDVAIDSLREKARLKG